MRSRGFAIIRLDDPTEFLLAMHLADGLRLEVLVENLVADVETLMRPTRIIIQNPCCYNVLQVAQAETHEVIQTFPF